MSEHSEYDAIQTTRLTPEELQKSVDRLSRSTRKETQLKPPCESKKITQAQLDARIKHLYDDSLARRQREREEVAEQMNREIHKDTLMTTPQISKEEEDALVKHLYDETLQLKQQNMQALYDQERSRDIRTTKTVKKSEQAEVDDRLYRGGMEREREGRIKLYEKYVVNRRAPAARRTRTELAASADKMTKGEGVGT